MFLVLQMDEASNNHSEKTGLLRELKIFGRASTSVGYCHIDTGCKVAITGMSNNNGITRAQNDTFYVSDALFGKLTVLERQQDNALVIMDTIPTDRGIDGISIDDDGVVWGAGFPDAIKLALQHFSNSSIPSPSSALRLTSNMGPSSYGEKYKVDKVFEDDGTIASGITSVGHDARRGLLFMHGCAAPRLVVCKV